MPLSIVNPAVVFLSPFAAAVASVVVVVVVGDAARPAFSSFSLILDVDTLSTRLALLSSASHLKYKNCIHECSSDGRGKAGSETQFAVSGARKREREKSSEE